MINRACADKRRIHIMIRLSTTCLLVEDDAGRCQPLDLQQLRRDLELSFEDAGVRDRYVPETVIQIVEDHLTLPDHPGHKPRQSATRVDTLIADILTNVGYGDVAACYCRRRETPRGERQAEASESWGNARIRAVLAKSMPLADHELTQVCRQVGNKLHALGFTQVSDDLIRSLGAHILQGNERNPDDTGDRTLLSPDACCEKLSAEACRYMSQGILRVQPVSSLLPVLRLELDLPALGRDLDADPLTELALFPPLRQCVGTARDALTRLRRSIHRQRPEAAVYPARLYITGIDAFFDRHFVPMGSSARRQLVREILALVRGETAERVDFPLVICRR